MRAKKTKPKIPVDHFWVAVIHILFVFHTSLGAYAAYPFFFAFSSLSTFGPFIRRRGYTFCS
jgi:hypothetical protein